MLTIKVFRLAQKQKRLEGGTFICPGCLSETYIFYAQCPMCQDSTFEARNTVNKGLQGRLSYYMTGWPTMDRLAHDRLRELRTKRYTAKYQKWVKEKEKKEKEIT